MRSRERDAVLRIGELSRRTGVSVPTLRAWERRYGLLQPQRTAGGQRLYTHDDVSRVLSVLRLAGEDWAVGAAAQRVAAHRGPPPEPDPSQRSQAAWPDTGATPARGSEEIVGGPETVGGSDEERAEHLVEAGRTGLSSPSRRATQLSRPRAASAVPGRRPDGLPDFDTEALKAVYQATRELLRIGKPSDAVAALVTLVHRLGGATTPARLAGADALPLDLSFGESEPILPVAEPFSLARLRLEALLPALIEDARHVVELVRWRQRVAGHGETDL